MHLSIRGWPSEVGNQVGDLRHGDRRSFYLRVGRVDDLGSESSWGWPMSNTKFVALYTSAVLVAGIWLGALVTFEYCTRETEKNFASLERELAADQKQRVDRFAEPCGIMEVPPPVQAGGVQK